MKLKNKIKLIFLLFFTIILFSNTKSYAGSQKWNSLDYDVAINSDGSMNVIETWNIFISETNTLFKNFEIDNSKYKDITNVKVSEERDGKENFLEEINEEQYHVTKGCFYALPINDGTKFEIAWNVGLDNSSATRIYKLYYTIENVVKVYNDCTELYWQFLGTENSIPGKNVSGIIRLPQEVTNIDKLRVWAHGDLTGKIEKLDRNLISFSLPNLNSKDMLEVRIVTEENIYENCTNIENTKKLKSILDEEQKWADKANFKRTFSKVMIAVIIASAIIINIVSFFSFKKKIIYYKNYKKEIEEKNPKVEKIKYFRDIPDEENATPGRAMFLYRFVRSKPKYSSKDTANIFTATLLDMSLKGIISFEVLDKNELKIKFNKSQDTSKLNSEYKLVYEILDDACGAASEITTKDFSNYAKKNSEEVYIRVGNIKDRAKSYFDNTDSYNMSQKLEFKNLEQKISIYTVFMIALFPLIIFIPVIYISMGIMIKELIECKNKMSILNEKRSSEAMAWKALKNYMKDYSLLKDKLVPDIVLWEKYLVYATAFGISEKVIEQLKVVHPEMFEGDYNNSYGYWNILTNTSCGIDGFLKISSNIGNIYNVAEKSYNVANSLYSSGSGGGDGFSSGGRRPEAAEAAVEAVRI